MVRAADLATPGRLQAHMRAAARRQYDAVEVPPFTLFFHPTDALPYFNYAVPAGPLDDAATLAAPLARLRVEFGLRGRRPRFEFVEEAYPSLAPALEAHGFMREARPLLMLCRRGKLRRTPPVAGLEVETLTERSPLEAFRAFLTLQRKAFGLPGPADVSEADARWLRDALGSGLAFLGRVGGEAVSVSMFLDPRDALTELVGIATLAPWRRRGIGAAMTAAALGAAFARGVAAAFLSAADARAGRVYEAAGFGPVGNVLFLIAPERARPLTGRG